jgi:tetratricopeptide (TPR) repeat protein
MTEIRTHQGELLDLAEAHEKGRVYFEFGDYAAAARLLATVAAAEPRNVSVRLLLARAYFHSAQLRRAEAELAAVVGLDPVDDFARFALGRALERQSRHAEALPHYRLAAAMRPDPEYLDALARCESRAALQPLQRGQPAFLLPRAPEAQPSILGTDRVPEVR